MTVARTVVVMATFALGPLSPGAMASATSDPSDVFGCDTTVHDPGGLLDRIEPTRAHVARTLGADVRVRMEPALDGGLDVRMAQLEGQCDGWLVDGDRAPDLVVVMVSAREREAGVFYGADQGPVLEDRWERAVDAMIAEFRSGDYSNGVRDGLNALARSSVTAPAVSPSSGERGNSAIGLLILLVVIVVAADSFRRASNRGVTGEVGSSGSSTRRRDRTRPFGSFGRSNPRRSASGSARRSSGTRRSGGGSKRW